MKDIPLAAYMVDAHLRVTYKFMNLKDALPLSDFILRGLLTGIWELACVHAVFGTFDEPDEWVIRSAGWNEEWAKIPDVLKALLKAGYIESTSPIVIKNWAERQPQVARRIREREKQERNVPKQTRNDTEHTRNVPETNGMEWNGMEKNRSSGGDVPLQTRNDTERFDPTKQEDGYIHFENFSFTEMEYQQILRAVSDDDTGELTVAAIKRFDDSITRKKRGRPKNPYRYLLKAMPDMVKKIREECSEKTDADERDPDNKTLTYSGPKKPPKGVVIRGE